MDITTIGTTILDRTITTIKSMETSLKIAQEHILVETTVDGLAKIHALVV